MGIGGIGAHYTQIFVGKSGRLRGRVRLWSRVVIGAGKIAEVDNDARRLVFAVDAEFLHADGESAKDEIAGVGHGGAAAGRDAVFRKEDEEFREEFVDGMSVLELGDVAGEYGAQVGRFSGFDEERGMAEAKARLRVDDAKTAAFAGAGAVLAAAGIVDGDGVRDKFGFHEWTSGWSWGGYATPVFL